MSSGLTTKEALCRLTQTLSNIRIPNNGLEWTRAAFFDLPSHEVLLCSIHALSAVMIFIAAMLQWNVSCSLGDVVLMLTLLIVPFFTLWLIHRRLRAPGSYAAFALKKLLSDLDMVTSKNNAFSPLVYPRFDILPHLSSVIQSTFRDGRLVSVPIILLVPGDVVLIKPGQSIPEFCSPDGAVQKESNGASHLAGDPRDVCRKPMVHTLHKPIRALVSEAPFVHLLRRFEEARRPKKSDWSSPLGTFIRVFLMFTFIVKWIILLLFCVTLVVRIWITNSTTLLASRPILFSFTLSTLGRFLYCSSGLGLSVLWLYSVSLVCVRAERIIFHHKKRLRTEWDLTPSSSVPSSRVSVISLASDACGSLPGTQSDKHDLRSHLRTIWSKFCLAPDPAQEQQLLMLGAISSVCCVNQEGILSRPIPSPEKIFFFHRRRRRRNNHARLIHHQIQRDQSVHSPNGTTHLSYVMTDGGFKSPLSTFAQGESRRHRLGKPPCEMHSLTNQFSSACVSHHVPLESSTAVYSERHSDRVGSFCSELEDRGIMHDLRTDDRWPYLPHFEKPRWVRFLPSLKPIGLSLLLSNCHSSVASERALVTDHLIASNAVARSADRFLPFTPLPFCLCGLAQQIGFQASASTAFVSCGCIGAYNFGSPTCPLPTKSLRENSPFPEHISATGLSHEEYLPSTPNSSLSSCFAAVFRDSNPSGNYQLLSQGTGDMLSSLCSDLWDGRDVVPMHYAEKSSLLDFYNRTASAAFCIGFAYAPLLERPTIVPSQSLVSDFADTSAVVLLQLPRSNRLPALTFLLSHIPTPVHHYPRPYSVQLPRPTVDYVRARNTADASKERRDKHRSWHAGPQFAPRDHERYDSCAIPEDFVGASELLHKDEEKTLVELVSSGGSVPAHSTRSTCSSTHSTRSYGDTSVDPRQLSSAVRSQIDDFSTPKKPSYVKNEQESPSDHATPTELQTVIENQIFLGLISMQYQVNASVLETIRRLSQACIRFVHFSRENELRSRVFAERLGLECEWNCHISLASPGHANPSNSAAGHNPRVRNECLFSVSQLKELFTHGSSTSFHRTHGLVKKIALERSGSVPHALPSTINKFRTLVRSPSVMTVVPHVRTVGTKRAFDGYLSFGSSPLDINLLHMRSDGSNMNQNNTNNNRRNTVSLHSDGSSTSSDTISSTSVEDETHNPERNDTLRLSDYLTQNKSRLPCGIENIRPHLMHVDNVPLQVSLFTDCTPDTTYQMITILQEYGEIVCTVGSCLSIDNIQPLARGDVAILMLPILPQPCTIFKGNPSDEPPPVSSPLCLEPSFRRRPRKWYKRFSHRSHPVDPETIALETQESQLRECITPIDSVELSSRIVSLLFPWVLDMQTHGFRIYPLVHEVRASVNNLYLLLTFSVLAPLSAALLQWLLLLVGLPSLPLITPSSFVAHSSYSASTPDRITVLWLPSQRIRMHLLPISDRELQHHSLVNVEKAVRLNHELAQSGYTAGQLLWLILFVVPALSLSLLDRQIERTRPLREPPTKRGKPVNLKKCIRTVVITALRFLPSVLVCAVCELNYFLFAPSFDSCNRITVSSDNWTQPSETDVPLSNLSLASVPQCVIQLSVLTALVKDVVFFQLILCLVATSFVFANYGQHIFKFRWSSNPSWCVSAFLILLLHSIYLTLRICFWADLSSIRPRDYLSLGVFFAGLSWCPLLMVLNELVAWKERRLLMAEHRLARLYFGTKLGMYSPV